MAGHLDLRHNGDEAIARVRDDLPYIVLRVEASVTLVVENVRGGITLRPSDEGSIAPCADLGEPRILLDLDAPALVVGEMPVECVHLMKREEIDVLLHELLRHEMARDIEVRSAPL